VKSMCSNCERAFEGRPNKQYCSVRCRRATELKMRNWDEAHRYVRFWEREAQRSTGTRAAEHRVRAERIRKRAGPTRP
jgi:hypothetical protein